jgi:hypothetical protein
MKETVMFRFSSSAILLAAILPAAGCGDGAPQAPIISEAVAAPAQAQAPERGWRTSVSPTAVDGAVTDYQ